jgi:hypothetical protein
VTLLPSGDSERTLELTILVKAAPVFTADLEEAMCVAAVTTGTNPEWIRLFPVPFRDLTDDQRFRKYQNITARVKRSRKDRRSESWMPIHGSIRGMEALGREHRWSARKELVRQLGEQTMCGLNTANEGGSGPGVPSLGVVRPLGRPTIEFAELPPASLRRRQERAEAAAGQASLFDDPTAARQSLEVVPWVFKYSYECRAEGCNGHRQTIVDWELVAFWRRVRNLPDWQDRVRHRFVDTLWASDRDTVLFVGNQEQHPGSFLVLGVFWPPTGQPQIQLPIG